MQNKLPGLTSLRAIRSHGHGWVLPLSVWPTPSVRPQPRTSVVLAVFQGKARLGLNKVLRVLLPSI